jgi:hypothetical protein
VLFNALWFGCLVLIGSVATNKCVDNHESHLLVIKAAIYEQFYQHLFDCLSLTTEKVFVRGWGDATH